MRRQEFLFKAQADLSVFAFGKFMLYSTFHNKHWKRNAEPAAPFLLLLIRNKLQYS